jgi:hypothetical protein
VNDDLFVTLTKYGVIFLHRFGEEQSLLIKVSVVDHSVFRVCLDPLRVVITELSRQRPQSKAAPRWRKPWKQGKHYIEHYRYGKFVGASQEYVVDSLRQLVLILVRPPHGTSSLFRNTPCSLRCALCS